MSKSKQLLGQFMTTNYKYITDGLEIDYLADKIIEPFCGEGDLLNLIDKSKNIKLECYDIDPKIENTIKQDTLLNPPNYKDAFVITNPPYLARNKSKNKDIYNKYDTNDLYKAFIITLINDFPIGGIMIIPLNFWCSIRKSDINLRKKFILKFDIIRINIFEERVFDDTSYTVCAFSFKLKNNTSQTETYIKLFPKLIDFTYKFDQNNFYSIGGDIYNLSHKNKYKITRATKKISKNCTNILVKCIDDNINSTIELSIVSNEDRYIDNTDKLSARSYATLIIDPIIDLKKQEILCKEFNIFLNDKRKKYNSLFLTNYRESTLNNGFARKRISFDLVYKICNHILDNI